ncbi:MAG: tetratricopeptide repeat protein [Candidatus Scalindua sp. AMX11]|nr:MAG: tetratricopeptide repeat protein [Candidatus Scalindua sp.]NOG84505.1 tetratricopeptide repeat protein [Planctomycetota bacterium]RZV80487.1 MAG: tetratricopeptide repeat protein [Candidatus Scalindua sp. SCAELEC01]TDE65292.1 MAG: tetratricopeptide repeat protein [Candidatus Scalindua sp. AMX11]GJQ58505.1 MAG: hypothetical protein SCALA701_13060 [Candidatus Scalindua sp.]
MKKILLFQFFLIIFLIAVFETTSYGSSKFKEYYNQAIEYYKQGKYDQAGKQFEMALDLKPNDAYALYGLGNTYYCKAKYDEAIKIYKKAISKNPDYAKVHYSLSLAYNKMGMTREAEKEKKIFRKISQGEKGAGKSSDKVTASRAPVKVSEHSSAAERDRSGFGLATGDKHGEQEHSDFGRTQGKVADKDKHGDTDEQSHAVGEKSAISTKADQAPVGTHGGKSEHSEQTASQGAKADHTFGKKAPVDQRAAPKERAPIEHRDATNMHVTSTHGTKKHLKKDDTHSIFQGYTKESTKPKSSLFAKKQGKFSGSRLSPTVYVRSEWTKSRIHKILICVIGYVFVTQMWLSVIAFFGFIVWRIRKKNLVG